MTRSTSSSVENNPRLNRNEFCVRCGGSPIARRTCDGSSVPDEHADPVDTAIPSRSSAISRLSASTRSKLMFGTSILDYSSRLRIAQHGFESVTQKLARDYDRYKETAARHGIEISARRVRRVLDTVEEQEAETTSVWRRVLEQTTGALLRQSDEAEEAGAGR